MLEVREIISTPISEVWPMWLMFALLLCGVLAEVLQPGTLRLAFRTTFTRLERTFGDRANNFMGSLLLNIFRVGTLAMSLYVFLYRNEPFSIVTYGYIILLIMAVLLLKVICVWWVSYTFDMRRAVSACVPQYDSLWTILCLLLYPINLLYINTLGAPNLRWMPIVALVLFGGLVVFKMLQNFYSGLRSLLYLLLYIVTLEFLPLGALIVSVATIA